MIVGPDGAAWVTDSGLNAIVRVDPRRARCSVFPLPAERRHANLNTATFDSRARSGSPARAGSTAGSTRRPARSRSGTRRAAAAPTASRPRRTATSTTPRSPAATSRASTSTPARRRSIEPPTPGQGARRVWSRFPGPRLGQRVERRARSASTTRRTGGLAQWKLPGDAPRAYAVYVDERDKVWLSDFGANALVRFDPADRDASRASRAIGAGAAVRQMLGRAGRGLGRRVRRRPAGRDPALK